MAARDPEIHLLHPHRLPAVLMGGINLVRALGMAGIQVVVATSDPEEPALTSRFCTVRAILPPRESLDAHVEALCLLGQALAGKYGRRVPLIYGSDEVLGMLHSHRDRLERFFLFLLNSTEVADALIAKDRFQAFAEARGLPVPRALTWEDGPAALRDHPGAVAVKPRAKDNWHSSALCQQLFDGDGKAKVYPTGAAAAADPDIAIFSDQLTFQEYVEGDDTALWSFHGFADERHEVVASFVGRKIRTYPAGMGESAFIELAHNADLEVLGREVVKRCPLRGPFKMDFKRDARTGQWFLLEINARFTLWHLVGAANGINLARVACEYLLRGERPAPRRYRTSRRWLWLELDYRAYKQLAGEGKLSFPAWLASVAFSHNIYNLFSWSDPMPWMQRQLAKVRRMASGGGRFGFLFRPWRSTAS